MLPYSNEIFTMQVHICTRKPAELHFIRNTAELNLVPLISYSLLYFCSEAICLNCQKVVSQLRPTKSYYWEFSWESLPFLTNSILQDERCGRNNFVIHFCFISNYYFELLTRQSLIRFFFCLPVTHEEIHSKSEKKITEWLRANVGRDVGYCTDIFCSQVDRKTVRYHISYSICNWEWVLVQTSFFLLKTVWAFSYMFINI